MKKIKITENQLNKLANNVVDPLMISNWIQKGDITALAHHYAKGDEEIKSMIIDLARSIKDEVFAQRIIVRAKGASMPMEEDMINELTPKIASKAVLNHDRGERGQRLKRDAVIALFREYIGRPIPFYLKTRSNAPAVKYSFIDAIFDYQSGDKKLYLYFTTEQDGRDDAPFVDVRKNITFVYNLTKDVYEGQSASYQFNPFAINLLIKAASLIRQTWFHIRPVTKNTGVDLGDGKFKYDLDNEATAELMKTKVSKRSFKMFSFDANNMLNLNEDEFNVSEEDMPEIHEEKLDETTTSASSGQYSSKFFLAPKGKENKTVLYPGGSIVEANPETHVSGENSFKITKGALKESVKIENSSVQEVFIENVEMKQENIKEAVNNIINIIKEEHGVNEGIPVLNLDINSPAPVQEDMTNHEHFNKVPKKIVKLANELKALIDSAKDSDGDAVGVIDTSGTWQSEDFYEIDIVNNVVIIREFDWTKKEGYPDEYDFNNFDPEEDYYRLQDCVDRIKYLIRLYKRTLKSLGNQTGRFKPQPELDETTAATASSGQYEAPLMEEDPIEEDRHEKYYDWKEIANTSTSTGYSDEDKLKAAFGAENVQVIEGNDYDYLIELNVQGDQYVINAVKQEDGVKRYAIKADGYDSYNVFDDLDELIGVLQEYYAGQGEAPIEKDMEEAAGFEDWNHQDVPAIDTPSTCPTCTNQRYIEKGGEYYECPACGSGELIHESEIIKSPAMANLDKIKAENDRITKAEMNKAGEIVKKATKTKGTQFVQEVPGGEEVENKSIDNTPAQDEINLIRKGMEDLNYDNEQSEVFQDRFEDGINPEAKSPEVTDQHGNKYPAEDHANVVDSDLGDKMLADIKKKKEMQEDEDPAGAFVPRVKIVKESEDFVITEDEVVKINEDIEKMKKLLGYKPDTYVSTKGVKTNNDLFKRK